MDAGVHVDAARGREVRTRLGVFSGFRNFIAVCLSACRRFLISHLLRRWGSPNQRTYPLVLIPEPNNVGFGDLKKEKKKQ
jgi:hypothetical protein